MPVAGRVARGGRPGCGVHVALPRARRRARRRRPPRPRPRRAEPDPGPRPKVGECHALSFRQALAVVGRTEPVACRKEHTAQTYFVGRLRLETPAGSTRRVDSDAAQRQARTTCLARLPRHLGVTPRDLRLTMAQAVWFTPSPQRAEAGADWFRCDVVAVASPRRLLQLPRRTQGWGGAPVVAMCATASPGTKAFRRVACGARHTWLAVSTVDIPGSEAACPGRARGPDGRPVRRRGQGTGRRPARLHLVAGEPDPGAVGRRPALRHLLGPGLTVRLRG